MKAYCLKRKKYTDNIDSKIFKAKSNRLIMQSKCSVCKNKKSHLQKNKMQKVYLSNLGIKTPFSKILLLNVLF